MRSCVGANDWDTVSRTHLQLLNCSEMLMTHFTRILHIRCHVLQPFLQERSIPADSLRSMTHNHRSIYIYPDAVPPIHAVSYHVATDKVTAQNGDKFRSIFSDNLQPIATRGKKARGTLLVDKHCGNGCSIKHAPISVSYYNEISGGHIGQAVVRTRCSAGPVLPLCSQHMRNRKIRHRFNCTK